jgi:hypothetical protein
MAKTRQQLSEERAIRLELFSSFLKREFVDYLAALSICIPIVPYRVKFRSLDLSFFILSSNNLFLSEKCEFEANSSTFLTFLLFPPTEKCI